MNFFKYIKIGICSKYFLLIIGICVFKFLKQSLFNFFQINPYSDSGIFGFMPVLYGHFVISSIYTYISYIIFSLLFYFISKRSTQSKYKFDFIKKRTGTNNSLMPKGFIHNQKAKILSIKKIIKVMGACSILVLQTDFSKIMYLYDISLFNIWTFTIIFILFFMKKYFIIEIFKHQKYSMFFVIGFCSILLILSTFFPYNSSSEYNSYEKVKEITGNYFAFIPILIIFISFTGMTSFFIVYSKVLMEIEMFPPYLLILLTGITGLILNIIVLIFTSFFPCKMENFLKSICIVVNKEGFYYDNLLIYFSNLKSRYINEETRSDFFLEIFLVIPLYLIFSFLEYVCQIFSIYYLNPNYILIKEPIYFGTLRLIFLFYNITNLSPVLYLSQFFLLEFAEVLAFLGYLVYLEVIELNFCGLDTNIKRKIINRNVEENKETINELKIISEDNDSDFDNERNDDSFISNNSYHFNSIN